MPRSSETAARMGRMTGKALTGELRRLAQQVHTIDDEGNPITREANLAEMIWRQAEGWVEHTRDESGNAKDVVHPPIAWCQQFLFERMEGKAPIAVPENDGGMRAADKVRSLVKDRVNALAVKAAVGGPPKYTPPK